MRVRGAGLKRALGRSSAARFASVAVLLVLQADGGSADGRRVQGDPRTLVVPPEEFRVEFAIVGGDYQPQGGYLAMYFRPEVLAAVELPGGDLLGVVAGLQILDDGSSARKSFEADTSVESVRASVRRSRPGSGPIEVQPLEARLEAAEDTVAFRLAYQLEGVQIVEYRYRILVGNAVANLIVSGRVGVGGSEPTDLADRARSAAEGQATRLFAALEKE